VLNVVFVYVSGAYPFVVGKGHSECTDRVDTLAQVDPTDIGISYGHACNNYGTVFVPCFIIRFPTLNYFFTPIFNSRFKNLEPRIDTKNAPTSMLGLELNDSLRIKNMIIGAQLECLTSPAREGQDQ
jgi:hypothetical protein